MGIFQKLSLVPRGLRYKLMISFCLMSVIPLLAAAYLMRDFIFPPTGDIISISWVLFFCMILAFLGLVLAKKIVEPVIEIALEARLIAEGDINRRISVDAEDEIGDLGRSINLLSRRIKGNMEELKSFGEKTKRINLEIHKRVIALSSMLQIGENITSAAQMDDIMRLIVEKMVQIMDTGCAAIFMPKTRGSDVLECRISTNAANEAIKRLEITIGEGLLGRLLISKDKVLYADSKTKFSKPIEQFKKEYDARNFAAFPFLSRGEPIGLLFVANNEERFNYGDDDLELIGVFAKQAAIAYESEELTRKAKEPQIKDRLTGLYNEKYIVGRLEDEIKRAVFYQRPCSYVLFSVDDFETFMAKNGDLTAEKALMKIAAVLRDHVSEVGRAARLSGDEFALLLPEKNKKEAYRAAESVRKSVEAVDFEMSKEARLTVSGGVSENPLDGSTPEELMKKAADSVARAKSQGKNRIA